MSSQTDTSLSPPIEGAIANPSNPSHYMVLKPIGRQVKIFAGNKLLGTSTNAIRLIEVGRSVYDPLVYVPADDLHAPLERLDKTSLCPLKGEAAYFAIDGAEIGWAYLTPYDFASAIKGYHSFWPDKVRIEEGI